ncbi:MULTISPECIES: LysR substrate-binding domain-containing protein [unclassified Variovorax]|uniref:LysR substrate-binding domain-containing protein n=1 Tax=unclassified Variovorax TaxID=663243 RepID=UPI001BD2267A|nr:MULTISPECIES: LysR substrate-binding domain-containing protein [unclassified Variovorax]
MINLRSVDLNLLPVFEAVYEESSLTGAAQRLSMSQPAVSNAVARLRTVFNDELFVRHGRGVHRTSTADAVYAKLHGALGTLRDSVSDARGFDPKTSRRSFFVSVSHPLGPLLAVRLRERLVTAAPGIQVSFSTRSRPVDLEQSLRDGRFDAAVDWLVPAGSHFNELALFEDAMVVVARRDHPVALKVRQEADLRSLEFVGLRPRIDGDSRVPGLQEWLRMKLNFAIEVSEILEVLLLTSQSDLVCLVPKSMLKLARDAFQLRALPVQVTTRTFPIKLVWAASKGADAGQVFIRKQIEIASRALTGR